MGRRLVAAVALICFTSCTWTATIARTDGLDNEAVISHSDADALYLRDRRGRLHRVERDSVKGIDHPGNVEMIVGLILMGITVFYAYDYRDEDKSIAPLILVWGGTGGAVFLSGLARYIPSLRAAWAFESADPPAKPVPSPKVAPPPGPPPAPAPPPTPRDDDEDPEVVPDAT